MRRRRFTSTFILGCPWQACLSFVASALLASTAAAQTAARPLVTIDARIGALWTGETLDDRPEETLFAVGGQLSFYPVDGPLARRFSIQISGDVAGLEDERFHDPVLGDAETYRYVFIVSPAVAFDVIQSPRSLVAVWVGGSVIGDETTFSLRRADSDEYQSVCDLAAFEQRCPSDYDGALHAGVGLRLLRSRNGHLTFGTAYTWDSGGRHRLAGTIGWMGWTRG